MRITLSQSSSLDEQEESEAAEIEELRRLLERTSHQAVGNFVRCGEPATTGLRKLDDGQNETMVQVRRGIAARLLHVRQYTCTWLYRVVCNTCLGYRKLTRVVRALLTPLPSCLPRRTQLYFKRKAEEELAQQISGLPAWDSSPYKEADAPKPKHVPMREIAGEKCTFEQRVYNPLMKAKQENRDASGKSGEQGFSEQSIKPKHAEMIEQMMRAYRHEQGAPKTMRSPRTGRLRQIQPLASGKIALGRTVTRRSSRSQASPQQLAKEARAEAAKAEAAAVKAASKAELLRRAAPPWAIGGSENPYGA